MTPETRTARHSEHVSEAGNRTIREMNPREGTGQGPVIIVIETHPKNGEKAMSIPFSSETAKNTNLADLIDAFCGDTEKATSRKLHVVVNIPKMIHARVNEIAPPPDVVK